MPEGTVRVGGYSFMGSRKKIDLSLKTDLVVNTAVLTCQQQVFLQIDFAEKLANFIRPDTMEYEKFAHYLEFKEGILLSVEEFSKFKQLKNKLTKENKKLKDTIKDLSDENKRLKQAVAFVSGATDEPQVRGESDPEKVLENYQEVCEELGL